MSLLKLDASYKSHFYVRTHYPPCVLPSHHDSQIKLLLSFGAGITSGVRIASLLHVFCLDPSISDSAGNNCFHLLSSAEPASNLYTALALYRIKPISHLLLKGVHRIEPGAARTAHMIANREGKTPYQVRTYKAKCLVNESHISFSLTIVSIVSDS